MEVRTVLRLLAIEEREPARGETHVSDLLPTHPLDDSGGPGITGHRELARETLCVLDVGTLEAQPHERDEHPLIDTRSRLLPEPIPYPEVAVLASMSQRPLPIEPRMPQLVVHEAEEAPAEFNGCVPEEKERPGEQLGRLNLVMNE